MSVPYVEILTDSRELSADLTSINQTITIQFKLPVSEAAPDQLATPVYEDAEFLGADDDVLALETAYGIFPIGRWLPTYFGQGVYLILSDLNVKQVDNHDWWSATAEYSFSVNDGSGGSPGGGGALTLPYIKIGFAGGGETIKITQSLEIVGRVSDDANPRPLPDLANNAIGATEDTIEGAEVYAGGLSLNITAYYYPSSITEEFLSTVADLFSPRCCTNSAEFLGFAAGECLLIKMLGDYTLNDIVPITFEVLVKKNINAQPDPPFTELSCEGHEFIDYRYIKNLDEDAQTIQQFPTYRFIHVVYRKVNFAALGFPTTFS